MFMKKFLSIATLTIVLGAFTSVQAQELEKTERKVKKEVNKEAKANADFVKKSGKAIKKTGKNVGKKTSELASKGKAKLVDKTYKGKQGPNGEVIYIDKNSSYYWVDKHGKKHYVTSEQLIDKIS